MGISQALVKVIKAQAPPPSLSLGSNVLSSPRDSDTPQFEAPGAVVNKQELLSQTAWIQIMALPV